MKDSLWQCIYVSAQGIVFIIVGGMLISWGDPGFVIMGVYYIVGVIVSAYFGIKRRSIITCFAYIFISFPIWGILELLGMV